MCGIIGYVGPREATPILLGGLGRLEYRGYDSAGIATLNGSAQMEIRRAVGKLNNLRHAIDETPLALVSRPNQEDTHRRLAFKPVTTRWSACSNWSPLTGSSRKYVKLE